MRHILTLLLLVLPLVTFSQVSESFGGRFIVTSKADTLVGSQKIRVTGIFKHPRANYTADSIQVGDIFVDCNCNAFTVDSIYGVVSNLADIRVLPQDTTVNLIPSCTGGIIRINSPPNGAYTFPANIPTEIMDCFINYNFQALSGIDTAYYDLDTLYIVTPSETYTAYIPAPTLNSLPDVDTTGLQTDNLLKWNGTDWVPVDPDYILSQANSVYGTGLANTLSHWLTDSTITNSAITYSSTILDASALTGALRLPSGTDAQDPVWQNGMLRYNTTTGGFQGYNGAERYLPWADADNWSSSFIPFSDGSKLITNANFFWDNTNKILHASGVKAGNTNATLDIRHHSTAFAGDASVSIGTSYAHATVYNGLVAIGEDAGQTNSGGPSVAIGQTARAGDRAVALGGNATAVSFSTAIGRSASTSFTGNSAIGNSAIASGNNKSVALGGNATASGARSIAIGGDVTASSASSIAIGNTTTASHSGAIAIGSYAVTTAQGDVVISPFVSGIPGAINVYFGSGAQRNTFAGDGRGIDYTINGSGGRGTNQNAGNITIAGGKGTGTGTPGDVIISTSDAGASGTTLQTLAQRVWVKGETGQLSVGTGSPDASALLQVESTTQGFLPPRMTTAQRDAIGSLAAGLMIFCTDCTADDTTSGVTQTYNGTTWKNHW